MTLSPPHFFRVLLAPLVVFAAVFAVLVAANGGGAPSVSVSADPGAPTGDPVADFQRAVRAAPDNAGAYAGLGSAYLARARETGDPGYYSRAERAFGAALRRDPRDLGALIGSGTLAGLRHDFRGQLALGRRAAAVAPRLARPLTVIADAQIELGRYGAAARSIQRLVDEKPGLAAYSRASYYRELAGDTAGAIEAMRLAASAGGAPENVAYVQALLGDLELQGGGDVLDGRLDQVRVDPPQGRQLALAGGRADLLHVGLHVGEIGRRRRVGQPQDVFGRPAEHRLGRRIPDLNVAIEVHRLDCERRRVDHRLQRELRFAQRLLGAAPLADVANDPLHAPVRESP